MNIASILSKPNIKYVPEHVELPDPIPQLPGEASYANVEDDVEDTRLALIEEIDILDVMLSELELASNVTSITVPEEHQEYTGSTEVTMSAYLENLSGDDYGPQAIRSVFESCVSDTDSLDTPSMMIPLVANMKDTLKQDMDSLNSDIFTGNFDPSGARDSALWAVRSNLAESQRLRAEVLNAAELANKALDKAIWAGVLDISTMEEMQAQGKELVNQLRRIQKLLVITTTLYSAEWQTVVSTLRDKIYSSIITIALSKMLNTYNQVYNKVVAPVQKLLVRFGSEAVNDVDEIQNLKNILSTSVGFVSSKTTDTLGDIYAIQQKKSTLRINGARAVGILAYTQRYIEQLDTIIAGVQTTLGSSSSSMFPLEAAAPYGNLGKLLENKQMYALSSKEIGLVLNEAPPLIDVASRIPETPMVTQMSATY